MGKNYFEMIRDGILVDGSGGGDAPAPVLITKSITANGDYSASADSADGFSSVSVSVPNSYSAGDEGKVVSNGALVAQTSTTVSQNGTIDTTTNDEVVVNVANSYSAADEGKVVSNGALVAQGSDTVTQDGTYDTTLINSLTVLTGGGGGGSFKSLTTSDTAISNNNMVIVENSDYIVASGTFNCTSSATRSFDLPTEILSSIDSIISAVRIRSNGTPATGSSAASINSWDRTKININAVSGSNAVIIQFSKKS